MRLRMLCEVRGRLRLQGFQFLLLQLSCLTRAAVYGEVSYACPLVHGIRMPGCSCDCVK